MAALIPALIKLLMSRGRGGGGGGYSRGGYGRGGGYSRGGGSGGDKQSDPIMYYTNLEALKELEQMPDWDKQAGTARKDAAARKADAVRSFLEFNKTSGE